MHPSANAPADAIPDDHVGRTLGNYRILRRLGAGGMGTVFLAQDLTLEREVALKIISPQLARNPVLMSRFKVEAIAQAKLNHKNIVTIHTFCQDEATSDTGRTYYFVMEYVEGISLKTLIAERGPMPVDQALEVFSQILDGIGYAHSRGVIHRDIKPANIFLDSNQTAKIGDFGIAKVGGIDGLTRMGSGLGSPLYSAPEQLIGQPADARSDIYSLGMTLYEMVAGTPPVRLAGSGRAAGALTPARSTDINPAVPANVDAVIMRSIAAEPARRFQTIEEFRRAIDGLRGTSSAVAGSAGGPAAVPGAMPDAPPWARFIRTAARRLAIPASVLTVLPRRTLRLLAAALGLALIAVVGFLAVSAGRNSHRPTVVLGSQDVHPGVPQPRGEPSPASAGSIRSPAAAGAGAPAAPAPAAGAPAAGAPTAASRTLSAGDTRDLADILARMQRLITQKEYARAISLGRSVSGPGAYSRELLQMVALAYFCDGRQTQSSAYVSRALDQTGSIRYPMLFETRQKRYVRGTLEITRRGLSFRTGLTTAPLLNIPLAGIKSVSDDVRGDIADLFKKKQNRKNPILIIKSRQDAQYRLQLDRDDGDLKKFIKHVITTLRGS
ncbi:MAG TPA: serine/threonine-protein kinase [Vicinamibacterales bacterium]|nr:serine/threonine-protein kinase [Vicinamibacterales bacterium]